MRPGAHPCLSHVLGVRAVAASQCTCQHAICLHGRTCNYTTLYDDATGPCRTPCRTRSYASREGISLCAFLGDTCATLELTPQLRELHTTYYEPLAEVV